MSVAEFEKVSILRTVGLREIEMTLNVYVKERDRMEERITK